MDRIDENLLKYVPKTKRIAIKAIWKDDDGYWIILKNGYHASLTDERCRTIHEDNIRNIRYQVRGIEIDLDSR